MSSYKEGQIHMLADSLEAAGFSGGDLTSLGQSKSRLALILGTLRGTHEIKPANHAIIRSKTPKLPFDGGVVEEHKGQGVSKLECRGNGLYLDGRKILLHLDRIQKNSSVRGYRLRDKLAKFETLDANILDYLILHQELIPDDWKVDEKNRTRYIFFWGTIFRSSENRPYVRYLYWDKSVWKVDQCLLDNYLGIVSCATILAS